MADNINEGWVGAAVAAAAAVWAVVRAILAFRPELRQKKAEAEKAAAEAERLEHEAYGAGFSGLKEMTEYFRGLVKPALDENLQLRKEMAELQNDNVELRHAMGLLEEENRELRTKVGVLEQQVKDLAARDKACEEAAAALRRELEVLRSEAA